MASALKRPLPTILQTAVLILGTFPGISVSLQAQTQTVNSLNDPGDGTCDVSECTLREAISAASSDDTVLFDAYGTIVLSAQLIVDRDLTIIGPSAGITLDGALWVHGYGVTVQNVTARIEDLTIQNCPTGITNSGTLTVEGVTITDCVRGIEAGGQTTIIKSTISGNNMAQLTEYCPPDYPGTGLTGAGILASGIVVVQNSTITDNSSAGLGLGGNCPGAGIYVTGSLNLYSSIVADNVGTPDLLVDPYLPGTLVDQGFNMTSGPTGLAPLADNGGPTWTHAIEAGDFPVDQGDCQISAATTDQRGEARPQDNLEIENATGGDGCDIGAFEAIVAPVPKVNSTDDPGDGSCDSSECTLRERVAIGGTVEFEPLLAGQAIGLRTWITIDHDVDILGSGAPGIRIVGNEVDGLTVLVNSGMVAISDLTIDADQPCEERAQGAVVENHGTLVLERVTITGGAMGAIENTSVLTMTNSTVSGNCSSFYDPSPEAPSGIDNSGTLLVQNSTISANHTNSNLASGIQNSGTANLYSSIVQGNTGKTSDTDLFPPGSFASNGFNIVSDLAAFSSPAVTDQSSGDAIIGPLADNGGFTRTHMPILGGKAVDAGDCSATGLTMDQRGKPRPVGDPLVEDAIGGDGCDVGAVELDTDRRVRVFLEGAYVASDTMSSLLFQRGDLPSSQPFSDTVFDGTVLDYDVSASVVAWAPHSVDWMLASVRAGTHPGTEIPGKTKPVLVQRDGFVVNIDGTPYSTDVADGSYYLVLRHRNHADVMTSSAASFVAGRAEWDFTAGVSEAYPGTGTTMKVFSDANTALFAGDVSIDGLIDGSDLTQLLVELTAGASGYKQSDLNVDGEVQALDFNRLFVNAVAGAASFVP